MSLSASSPAPQAVLWTMASLGDEHGILGLAGQLALQLATRNGVRRRRRGRIASKVAATRRPASGRTMPRRVASTRRSRGVSSRSSTAVRAARDRAGTLPAHHPQRAQQSPAAGVSERKRVARLGLSLRRSDWQMLVPIARDAHVTRQQERERAIAGLHGKIELRAIA